MSLFDRLKYNNVTCGILMIFVSQNVNAANMHVRENIEWKNYHSILFFLNDLKHIMSKSLSIQLYYNKLLAHYNLINRN